MSEHKWALVFKQLMDILMSFLQIVILPGTKITVLDIAIWSAITFLVMKALYSLYGG